MRSANLDLLRACAVLSVAMSHLYVYAGGSSQYRVLVQNIGVGGVMLFFVHTSLVLFHSLERTQSERFVIGFYIRRFFRIYPLCWLCIVLVLVTKFTDIPRTDLSTMGLKGILSNVLLLQNLSGDCSVVGPLWSLPWEVQMYLVMPFLFVIVSRKNTLLFPLGIWSFTMALASWTSHTPRMIHSLRFFPMFMGGMAAYQMRGVRRRVSSSLWPLFILTLVAARVFLLQGDSTDTPWNSFINSAVCLMLGLAIPMFKEVSMRSVASASRTVAEYSYGIYLFHVPMLALCFEHMNSIPRLAKAAAWVISTAFVTFVLYGAVEKPLIKLGKRLAAAPLAEESAWARSPIRVGD